MQDTDKTTDNLDYFGTLVCKYGRDTGTKTGKVILEGTVKAPIRLALAKELGELGAKEHQQIFRLLQYAIDSTLHGILCELYNREEFVLLVNGVDIREISDGWHGDYFGWIETHSEFPDPNDDVIVHN